VAATGIAKVGYTHDAMVDQLIATPHISQGELASIFGYSQTWVSQVINSDAFQARLAHRKEQLADPLIIRSIEERFRAVAQRSLDIVLEKLDSPAVTPKFALEAAKLSSDALGYGAAKSGQSGGPSVQVVVQVPAKSESAQSWAAKYGAPVGPVEEAVLTVPPPPVIDHETAKVYE
jgi:hypothetical protein